MHFRTAGHLSLDEVHAPGGTRVGTDLEVIAGCLIVRQLTILGFYRCALMSY